MQKTKEYQYYKVLIKGYEEFVYRASSEVTSLQCIDEDGEWFSTRRTPEQFILFVAPQYAPDHRAYLSGPIRLTVYVNY